jgi:hypothetical protein
LNRAAVGLNAGGLFGNIGFDSIAFMTAWFIPQDSALQFGGLDCAADDIINCEPAIPEIIP